MGNNSILGKVRILTSTDEIGCSGTEDTRANLLAIATASQLQVGCNYVMNDYNQGTLGVCRVIMQAVSVDTFGRAVQFDTTYDDMAWIGEYDIVADLTIEVRDNLGNIVRDDTGVTTLTFDWGNTAFTSNEFINCTAISTDIASPNITWMRNQFNECSIITNGSSGVITDNKMKQSGITTMNVAPLDFSFNNLMTSSVTDSEAHQLTFNSNRGFGLVLNINAGTTASVTFQGNQVETATTNVVAVSGLVIQDNQIRNSTINESSAGASMFINGCYIAQNAFIDHLAGVFNLNFCDIAKNTTVTANGALDIQNSNINTAVSVVMSGTGGLNIAYSNIENGATITNSNANTLIQRLTQSNFAQLNLTDGGLSIDRAYIDNQSTYTKSGAGDTNWTNLTLTNNSSVVDSHASGTSTFQEIKVSNDSTINISTTLTHLSTAWDIDNGSIVTLSAVGGSLTMNILKMSNNSSLVHSAGDLVGSSIFITNSSTLSNITGSSNYNELYIDNSSSYSNSATTNIATSCKLSQQATVNILSGSFTAVNLLVEQSSILSKTGTGTTTWTNSKITLDSTINDGKTGVSTNTFTGDNFVKSTITLSGTSNLISNNNTSNNMIFTDSSSGGNWTVNGNDFGIFSTITHSNGSGNIFYNKIFFVGNIQQINAGSSICLGNQLYGATVTFNNSGGSSNINSNRFDGLISMNQTSGTFDVLRNDIRQANIVSSAVAYPAVSIQDSWFDNGGYTINPGTRSVTLNRCRFFGMAGGSPNLSITGLTVAGTLSITGLVVSGSSNAFAAPGLVVSGAYTGNISAVHLTSATLTITGGVGNISRVRLNQCAISTAFAMTDVWADSSFTQVLTAINTNTARNNFHTTLV